jgi:hypothetical protein
LVLGVPAARPGVPARPLDAQGLAHRAIGTVVPARGDERVHFVA